MPDWSDWKSALAERETGAETRARTSRELLSLGTHGYMQRYPEIYDPSWKPEDYNVKQASEVMARCAFASSMEEIRAAQRDLSVLSTQFTGPESTYIRWVINNRINQLHTKAENLRATTFGWNQGRTTKFEPEPPPIPDWMREYMEPSMPAGEPSRFRDILGRGREKAVELRPMGAQAELTPERMGQMAGYQAWGKAGSPTGVGSIAEMADWRRWWEPYVSLSKSLFPQKTKLGTRRATAEQR